MFGTRHLFTPRLWHVHTNEYLAMIRNAGSSPCVEVPQNARRNRKLLVSLIERMASPSKRELIA